MTARVTGPVVVAAVGEEPVEAALRTGFAEADRLGAGVTVLAVGRAGGEHDSRLTDLVDRWADKYPQVSSTLRISRRIDAIVTLTAASRSAALVVLCVPAAAGGTAVANGLRRRAHCPLVLVHDP